MRSLFVQGHPVPFRFVADLSQNLLGTHVAQLGVVLLSERFVGCCSTPDLSSGFGGRGGFEEAVGTSGLLQLASLRRVGMSAARTRSGPALPVASTPSGCVGSIGR